VHVSLYHSSTPLYIHAKAMSVNNTTVYVGSGNFTTTMTNDDRNAGMGCPPISVPAAVLVSPR
jgi:hypothetical protein